MKINPKILSIPPYISTAWKNVLSLHVENRTAGSILIIGLVNSSTIEIPNLKPAELEAVFHAHEKYLEKELAAPSPESGPSPLNMMPGGVDDATMIMNLPLRLGIDPSMGNLLQHNQEASHSPDLPKEVLDKICHLSKMVGFDKQDNLPKPEPHCNCMHCQIMRVFHEQEESMDHEDEEVSLDDLRFRDWQIEQMGDQLYLVTNPLNGQEQYTVFLGNPVGCTCGESNCEHIRSVLNS